MEVFYIISAACWCGFGIYLYNAELARQVREKDKDPIGRRDLALCCCIWPIIFILGMLQSLLGFFIDRYVPTLQWMAFLGTFVFIIIAKAALPEQLILATFYASIVALCAGYSIAELEKKQKRR